MLGAGLGITPPHAAGPAQGSPPKENGPSFSEAWAAHSASSKQWRLGSSRAGGSRTPRPSGLTHSRMWTFLSSGCCCVFRGQASALPRVPSAPEFLTEAPRTPVSTRSLYLPRPLDPFLQLSSQGAGGFTTPFPGLGAPSGPCFQLLRCGRRWGAEKVQPQRGPHPVTYACPLGPGLHPAGPASWCSQEAGRV